MVKVVMIFSAWTFFLCTNENEVNPVGYHTLFPMLPGWYHSFTDVKTKAQRTKPFTLTGRDRTAFLLEMQFSSCSRVAINATRTHFGMDSFL
jgi:hypothetical protein